MVFMTKVCVVTGGGLGMGLSTARLLAKSGFETLVIDHSNDPGGTCGIFKRKGVTFDQGAAMLYGFGDSGFNAYRLFCLIVWENPSM